MSESVLVMRRRTFECRERGHFPVVIWWKRIKICLNCANPMES